MSSSSSSGMLATKLNKNPNGNGTGKKNKRSEEDSHEVHEQNQEHNEGQTYGNEDHEMNHVNEEEANQMTHQDDDDSDVEQNGQSNMQLQHVLLGSSHLEHYGGHNTSMNQSFSNESTYSNDDHRSKKPRVLHPIWEYCAEPHPQFPDSRVICKFCGISLRLPFGYKLERLREHYGLNVHFIRETKRGKGCIKNPFPPNEILPFSTPGATINTHGSSNNSNSYLDWKDHAALPYKLDQHNTDGSMMDNAADSDAEEQNNSASSINATNPNRVKKRNNYLSWDDYFMSISLLSAMRSKDPNTQVGACIVNDDQRIVGIGYNGFPRGCSDDELPWNREAENELDTKYPYVCHAEVNAILNKNSSDVKDCKMYVALFPCNECAKVIIQSGINEVVYMSDKYAHTTSMQASRRMFNMSKVKLRQFYPTQASLQVNFSSAL